MVQEFRIAGEDETEAPGLLGLLMKAESKEMKEVFIFDMSDSEDVHEAMGENDEYCPDWAFYETNDERPAPGTVSLPENWFQMSSWFLHISTDGQSLVIIVVIMQQCQWSGGFFSLTTIISLMVCSKPDFEAHALASVSHSVPCPWMHCSRLRKQPPALVWDKGAGKGATASEMIQMKMPGNEIVSEGGSTPPDLMHFYGLTKAAASYQVKVLIWRACLFLYFTLFVSFFVEEIAPLSFSQHTRTRTVATTLQ
ncbi:unnamed protein product [Amoebophrya sp. A120]|nr:unnamed protein product [Amoebophrya sp. A120]|eukprot:GSA120T00004167001.1